MFVTRWASLMEAVSASHFQLLREVRDLNSKLSTLLSRNGEIGGLGD